MDEVRAESMAKALGVPMADLVGEPSVKGNGKAKAKAEPKAGPRRPRNPPRKPAQTGDGLPGLSGTAASGPAPERCQNPRERAVLRPAAAGPGWTAAAPVGRRPTPVGGLVGLGPAAGLGTAKKMAASWPKAASPRAR